MRLGEPGPYEHGGDAYDLGPVVDFSASLNPLGMPAPALRALRERAGDFAAYPDPASRDLTRALADVHDIAGEQVAVTAGATDAFSRIARVLKPRRALVCAPCYSGYEQALAPLATNVAHHSLRAREHFDVTDRIIGELDPGLDLVILCSPNNPTGRVVHPDLLRRVVRTADRWGVAVVVDESFAAFADAPSARGLLEHFPQLVIVRGFTKTYAMAGLRLGYCLCGRADLAQRIRQAGDPWAVSAPAQVAGLAALDAPGYLDLTREYAAAERDRVERGLAALGLLAVPSHANFVLFQAPATLADDLLDRGFLIRRCGNFRGLDATWFRVGVRTAPENEQLLQAIGEVLR